MVIKNILVDLDGTLVLTSEANSAAYQASFEEAGIPFNRELFLSSFGLRFDDMISRLAPQATIEQRHAVKVNKARVYEQFFHLVKINSVLVQFLNFMKSTCAISLVTTASTRNAQSIIEHFSLHSLFSVMVFGDDVVRGKPAPDCYLHALKLLGADAAESVAIEDSESGVISATQAGIAVIRVPEGWE